MNKRGSHVGMILSFVLFVTALIFLYDIMKPATTTKDEKEKLIEQVKMSLEKELRRELITSTVRIDPSKYSGECVKLNYSKFGRELSNEHLVKNFSGKVIESKIDGESLFVGGDVPELLRIFFAEGLECEFFGKETSSCKEIDGSDYIFTTSKKEYYFEKDLEKFIENMENEEKYSEMKERFLLPVDVEFNLIITLNGERKGKEKSVSGTNIFANQYPITYINSSADVNSGFFDIFVW